MERVAVEVSGQGDIMIRIPNSNHTWAWVVLMLPLLPGIGSDVVLTPGNFQAYPECCSHFYTQATDTCVLRCKHQESRKIVALSIVVAPPLTTFLLH